MLLSKSMNPRLTSLIIGKNSLPIFLPARLNDLPINASRPWLVSINASVEPVTSSTAFMKPSTSFSSPLHLPVLFNASSEIPYWSRLANAPLTPLDRSIMDC